ncbi:hypothetical protein COCOBI_06-2080 [Coccomyxa sp. Obi]|nr:hypothetical protein COCOBI_06-2080 [Coccomyxa sp. Obi]
MKVTSDRCKDLQLPDSFRSKEVVKIKNLAGDTMGGNKPNNPDQQGAQGQGNQFMQMAENALGGSKPGTQAGGQQAGAHDEGFDWSSLGKLVKSYQGAAQQSNGEPSFGQFQNILNDQGHGQALNSGMVDKLSGLFQKQTGQAFGGSGLQSNMMAQYVSSKLGFDVPPQMLQKL